MQHTIIISHADGTTTTLHTQADNAKQAHEYAETKRTADTDTIRTYATTQDENGAILIDGVQAGALTVCRRTTANMIAREGGNLQHPTLYKRTEREPHRATTDGARRLAPNAIQADGARATPCKVFERLNYINLIP